MKVEAKKAAEAIPSAVGKGYICTYMVIFRIYIYLYTTYREGGGRRNRGDIFGVLRTYTHTCSAWFR